MEGVFTAGGGLSKTPPEPFSGPPPLSPSRQTSMRAEIEHLVDETKQSVGLLRRHL
jgi:hypothetical protein